MVSVVPGPRDMPCIVILFSQRIRKQADQLGARPGKEALKTC